MSGYPSILVLQNYSPHVSIPPQTHKWWKLTNFYESMILTMILFMVDNNIRRVPSVHLTIYVYITRMCVVRCTLDIRLPVFTLRLSRWVHVNQLWHGTMEGTKHFVVSISWNYVGWESSTNWCPTLAMLPIIPKKSQLSAHTLFLILSNVRVSRFLFSFTIPSL